MCLTGAANFDEKSKIGTFQAFKMAFPIMDICGIIRPLRAPAFTEITGDLLPK
jgi:hypothetical protein